MILGIDYGNARTGFAISENGFIAGTLETFAEKNMNKVAEHAAELVLKHNIDRIVVGLPKNMDGSIGDSGKKAKRLAKMIKELTGVKIVLWDERLTTVSAHNLMNETNVRGQKRKDSVDKIAAAFILQSYLDSLN